VTDDVCAASVRSRSRVGTVRRRVVAANAEGNARRPPQGSLLRFYTDESPGLKITPVVVLGMSVCFIGFVTMLHAIAKISAYTSGK
jgi:protein transport protein SEC61 subunit beta